MSPIQFSTEKNPKPYVINIVPQPKPRMTKSDSWKKRPCVVKYWEFKDALVDKMKGKKVFHPMHLIFVMPMPKSWSMKKKESLVGEYHKSRPDADNMWKAWNDCLYDEDGHIADNRITKVWGWEGKIIVAPLPPLDGKLLQLVE